MLARPLATLLGLLLVAGALLVNASSPVPATSSDMDLGFIAPAGQCVKTLFIDSTGGASSPEAALAFRFPGVTSYTRVDLSSVEVRFDVFEGVTRTESYLVQHNGDGWTPARAATTGPCNSSAPEFHHGVTEPAPEPVS